MEEIYKAIVDILQRGQKAALITIISRRGSTPAPVGSKMLVMADGNIVGTVGGGVVEAEACRAAKGVIESGKSGIVSFDLKAEDSICGGCLDVFIEPVSPAEKLYIFGAGHVANSLSKIAALTGFRVIIIDDRKEYANTDNFPEAEEIIVSEFSDAFQKLNIDSNSFIVIVTHGHTFDKIVLEWACGTEAKYIGMIGSKSKVRQIFDELIQKGISEEKLQTVHAPIGLKISSETPAEIAVSIMAEIIQIRHGA